MIKKAMLGTMACALAISLAACGGNTGKPAGNTSSNPSNSSPAHVQQTQAPQAQNGKKGGAPQKYTGDLYNKINLDMTYAQVVQLVGADGDESDKTESNVKTSAVYTWKNPDGSSMNVTIKDGKVVSKAQMGLR
ncbi:hypothetical protein GJ688_11590 [Heliobacillus mobilis]|uniref:Lipoprotein n=1 Tax=Heliobacterium mobile TaxID=28064 RepID=A0A6I3SL25_HELMO|nr:hypothetical protein [Heliobacterium mobile]MTV49619.1 hypothetical protein [Heliobacterium mobile]